MANKSGKVPGTYVSEGELNELGNLLTTMRDYILSHEARIELIEGWIGEFHKENDAEETDGTSKIEAYDAAEAANLAEFASLENEGGLVLESPNDPA